MMTPLEIRSQLSPKYHTQILDFQYPEPYCQGIDKVKAILLGCDPSNQHSNQLPYVFALESDLAIFNSFLKSWKRSLEAIGLNFDNVYIQNLCRNYFAEETSRNKIWGTVAKLWIPALKEELKQFDKSIPVLLSAEVLLKVLLMKKEHFFKAKRYYTLELPVPIPAEHNLLQRHLIPFYRHPAYAISRWPTYAERISRIL